MNSSGRNNDPAQDAASSDTQACAAPVAQSEGAPATAEIASGETQLPLFSLIAGVILVLSLFVPKLLLIVPIIVVVCLSAIGLVRKEQPFPLPIVTSTLAVVFFIMASADVSTPPLPADPTAVPDIGWVVDSFKDTMSDKVTYYASLDDTTGTAHFDIHCTPDHVSYTFAGDAFLGDGERTLEYRFDADKSQSPRLNYYDKSVSIDASIKAGHIDPVATTDATAALLGDLSRQLHDPARKQLLVRLYGFDYMSHEYVFPLHDTRQALASLEKSCGHPV